MSINVLIFASLSEDLGLSRTQVSADSVKTALGVWQKITDRPLSNNVLIAVNQEYAAADTDVHSGDEVAFFPPVTGG